MHGVLPTRAPPEPGSGRGSARELVAKYGITPEQYDALRAGHNFRCAICGIHEADVDLKRVGGRPRRDGQPLGVGAEAACQEMRQDYLAS